MSLYARVDNNIVAEIISVSGGENIDELFHSDFVATCFPCGKNVSIGWSWDGEYFAPPVLASIDLVAYAAAKRFDVETRGITVSGTSIKTDRESQSKITGAYIYTQTNPEKTVMFKALNGFVELDKDAVAVIADAVGAHVQACFAIEAELVPGISAHTITTPDQIDSANWPE